MLVVAKQESSVMILFVMNFNLLNTEEESYNLANCNHFQLLGIKQYPTLCKLQGNCSNYFKMSDYYKIVLKQDFFKFLHQLLYIGRNSRYIIGHLALLAGIRMY